METISLITGANAGIGKETALALAKQGARVVMMCRDLEKGEAARREIIRESHNDRVDVIRCDLNDLHSVKAAAAEFTRKYDRLHVLVNNAGFMTLQQQRSADGFESTFAVNYLAHVLLTLLLLDTLKASAPARVINVSSGAHRMAKLDLEDLMMEKTPYKGFAAYCNSKLANVLFTYELARELQGSGVTVNTLDPGMVRTQFADELKLSRGVWILILFLLPWAKTAAKGALTSIKLASDPKLAGVTGTFWKDAKLSKSSAFSQDEVVQRELHAKAMIMLEPYLK